MAISNTHILVKRSTTTATPTNSSLLAGELAYSYSSNTAFIGNSDGVGVLKIGGQAYTSQIDAATTANTASTIVKRDVNGSFSGNLIGNAISSSSLNAPQNFSISGGDLSATAVAFSGNNAIVLNASLNAVPGLTAGSVGSGALIPIITYGANGRILAVSSAAVVASVTVSGNTGSDTFGSTITVQGAGGSGINTVVSGAVGTPIITINTDNTVVRSNTALVGPQIIGTDVQISGNLIVLGSQTTINSSTVATNDSMIQLANNNTLGDVVDIGFYGVFNNGTTNNITGLVRDAGSKNYYLFSNVAYTSTFNSSNVIASNLFTQANTATLYANLNSYVATVGNLTLTNALPVTSGGTGVATLTGLAYGNGTGVMTAATTAQALAVIGTVPIANGGTGSVGPATVGGVAFGSTTTALGYTLAGTSGYILTSNGVGAPTWNVAPSTGVTTVSGGTTGLTPSTATSGAVTLAGTLVVSNGGTGAATFAVGSILVGSGTGALTALANTGTAGVYGSASYHPVITTDAYGRVSSVANTQVVLDLTSTSVTNTLPFLRGGTGSTAYTTGTILVAGATGFVSLPNTTYTATGTGATSNTVSSLTVDAYGRVTAATYSAISGLTVTQGGTGFATAATNGIVFGNGTAAMGVTAVAGGADQTFSNQILTVTNAGVPIWSTSLDGGQF